MKPIFRLGRKRTIIIGIHGLSNKPTRKRLKRWWRKSIKEGLLIHWKYKRKIPFQMVYWADILYKKPLNPQEKNEESPFFIDEPYLTVEAIKSTVSVNVWQKISGSVDKFFEYVFLSKFGLARFRIPFDILIKRSFKDLDTYYNENNGDLDKIHSNLSKKIIRDRLKKVLTRYRHRKVLLIAHSMGSIIAHDVLYELEKSGIGVDTFITMGSPLGLPMIRQKFNEEFGLDSEPEAENETPNNIANWYNITDADDQLAAHYQLSEVFSRNKNDVAPIDQLVENDYKNWETANAHKSFGYLRTVQLSEVVFDFLTKNRKSLLQRIKSSVLYEL